MTRLVLLAGLLIGAMDRPTALAHGDPEKVVDGRMSVGLALAPGAPGTRLRFRFNDTRTGRPIATPLTMQLSLRDPGTGGLVTVRHGLRVHGGLIDVTHAFTRSDPREVLIEFERDDEPGRTYRPDDWLIVPPGASGSVSWSGVAGLAAVLSVLAAPALYARIRDRDRTLTADRRQPA